MAGEEHAGAFWDFQIGDFAAIQAVNFKRIEFLLPFFSGAVPHQMFRFPDLMIL
jgi:hypothetical protein